MDCLESQLQNLLVQDKAGISRPKTSDNTIVAILVLGGAQLLALGIISEYLGRLHMNVNRKPQYRERQVLGQHETGQND